MGYKRITNKKSIPEFHFLKQTIKDMILKDISRHNIIQYMIDQGYKEITAIQYYCDCKNEIKSDFADRADTLREIHISIHKANLEEANQIDNIKDKLQIKTKIMERMEKITGLEETNLNIKSDDLNQLSSELKEIFGAIK